MWSYFLAAILIKTPTAFLVLHGVRVADQAVRRDPGVRSLLFLIVPALGWLLATAVTALPLGVRYVLPMSSSEPGYTSRKCARIRCVRPQMCSPTTS